VFLYPSPDHLTPEKEREGEEEESTGSGDGGGATLAHPVGRSWSQPSRQAERRREIKTEGGREKYTGSDQAPATVTKSLPVTPPRCQRTTLRVAGPEPAAGRGRIEASSAKHHLFLEHTR